MTLKHLRVWIASGLILLVTVAALEAKSRKGEKFYKQGEAAELRKDWDAALDAYQSAVDESPGDAGYLIAMRRVRFQAGQMHVDRGEKLRTEGKLNEAMEEFTRALIADPASPIAVQNLRQTRQMIERGKQPGAKPDEANLTPIERARKESEDRISSIMSVPELKPTIKQVPPLKMNNQPPRVLYETVGKVAGINVLFDSQYSGRNQGGFNVDLNTSSVEESFDYLAMLTRTFWKPISANTIFVTEDNPTKRRDFEDNVLKIFYVTNTTTVQEFQEIAQAVRTIPEVRRTFTYNAQKAIVVRGTADQVAMAEKLIHDLDKPKSEVVVDVIVMEANSSHTRNLAASIVSGTTAGLNIPIQFAPRSSISNTTTTGTGSAASTSSTLSLAHLGKIDFRDYTTTLPNALLNLMLTDTSTKVRQHPQIRASDGQKAQLNIGDRIPYATGSFQPGVGTVGVSPLVQTQFNFVDTGVNVDITPFVHSAEELTLHIEINVSTVRDRIDIGGVSQPIIGQRKSTADIRLREGEVNILGGLSQWQDSKTVNGIPGLVNIPIFGKLFFGSQNTDKERGNLMIALIPHIVRTPDYSAENVRSIGVGNDATVKLQYNHAAKDSAAAPEPAKPPAPAAQAPAAVVNPGPVKPGNVQPNSTAPQTPAPVPQPIANLQAPPGLLPGATPAPSSGAPPPPPPAGAPAAVAFLPSPVTMNVAGIFPVNIQLKDVNDLFAISTMRVKYDPNILKLNDLAAGELISRDGRVTTVKEIHEDVGEATFTVTRMAGTPGVSGTGNIVTLNFTAVRAGSGPITVTEMNLKNSQQQPIAATLGETMVTVR